MKKIILGVFLLSAGALNAMEKNPYGTPGENDGDDASQQKILYFNNGWDDDAALQAGLTASLDAVKEKPQPLSVRLDEMAISQTSLMVNLINSKYSFEQFCNEFLENSKFKTRREDRINLMIYRSWLQEKIFPLYQEAKSDTYQSLLQILKLKERKEEKLNEVNSFKELVGKIEKELKEALSKK